VNNRILVTYATRAGSTVGVADAIALGLRQRGFLVEVRPAKENPSVKGYQAVIVGSAIRQGSWLPEAIAFLIHNQAALRRVRVALFTVHMLNRGDDEQSRQNREAYLDALRPLVLPVAHVFFPGKIDPARLSLIDRLLVRLIQPPIGDFRDWDQIRGWAETLLTQEVNRST
jgi:menaquinone-dependent protoporphyrinogen oxidase